MRSKLFSSLLAVLVLVSLLAAPVSAGNLPSSGNPPVATDEAETPTAAGEKLQLTDASSEVQLFNGRYFVLLEGESLVQSLSENGGRIQVDAPEAQAYLTVLRREQDARLQQISRVVQRFLQPIFRYDVVLNGFALQLSAAEAARIRGLPGVRAVIPDRLEQPLTDAGPAFIRADQIWNGNTPAGVSTKGEGIVVGILDTGINFDHPSFADDADPAYTYPSTTPKGVCAVSGGLYENACNNKLIGAYSFTTEAVTPEDTDGHGSHTASTVAGNKLTIANFNGVPNVTISGVAPRAQIIAYDVCDEQGCATTASVAAVQQAILDEVDVINYSISGGRNPYNDPVELAFLEAFDAGIFVAASAGNLRNEAGTDGQVNHVSPWVMTVAASSHDRRFGHLVDVVEPYNDQLLSLFAVPGSGPKFAGLSSVEIRFDENNATGCSAYSSGFFDGAIALIQRGGDCFFVDKVEHAQTAGAVGVLVFNNAGFAIPMGGLDATTIPSAMLDQEDGEALQDYILQVWNASSLPVKVDISAFDRVVGDYGDIKADFSLRGPSANDFEVLKPDITAPGLEILAAAGDGVITPGSEAEFDLYQGTSMSSPHVAGAAALLKALHPGWSPAAIKSALMMTAQFEGLRKADRSTPADAFDHGAGRVDLGAAARAGLILDETTANFEAADPANGGDPKTLNLPGLQNNFCVASCAWTRTFKNVSGGSVSMTINSPPWLTAVPSSFTLADGETQAVTFTADVSGLPLNEWSFATVKLETNSKFSDGKEVADLHLPVAVRPMEQLPDRQPPLLVSLRPAAGFPVTNQQRVTFLAEFSEDVQGVDASDFAPVEGGGVSGSFVDSVSGSGKSFTITVDTGSGSGSLGLQLRPEAEITDLADNRLRDIPPFDPFEVYWIDKIPPVVQSQKLLEASPTNAAQVRFELTFSEPIFGLTSDDFEAVQESGLTGSSVKDVQSVNPQTCIITLLTGSPEGRLGLRLKAGAPAHDEAGNALGGLPYFDSNSVYWVDKIAPQVNSLRRMDENPAGAEQVRFEVKFSEAVQNVAAADFAVVEKGELNSSVITAVQGSGDTYQIFVQIGKGSGTLGLRLPAESDIQDAAGNRLKNLPFYDPAAEYRIEFRYFVYLPLLRK